MPLPRHLVEREQVAHEELAAMEVSRPSALALIVGMALLIFGVPLLETVRTAQDASGSPSDRLSAVLESSLPLVPFREGARAFASANGGLVARVEAGNRTLRKELRRWEQHLEEASLLRARALPVVQRVLGDTLGAGSEQVLLGRNGWLFHRPCVGHVAGRPFLHPDELAARRKADPDGRIEPDPRVGIGDFAAQLRARGVQLLVILTPEKPVIDGLELAPNCRGCDQPVHNPSFPDLVRDLEAAGVHVFDPSPLLAEARRTTGRPMFLPTDTHWTPEAVERTAAALAEKLRGLELLPAQEPAGYLRDEEPTVLEATGDLLAPLGLPHDARPKERVSLRYVRTPRGDRFQPMASSDVLVIGDSFTNIYSQDALGFGGSSGLVEQLAFELQRPLDALLRNGASANATRDLLSRELGRGRDRLAGKRLLIWQLAIRELSFGDWRKIPMELRPPPPPRFLAPKPGQPIVAKGRLLAIAGVPRPGSTPYKDQLAAALIGDLEGEGVPPGASALAYVWGMKDNVWVEGARLRVGQTLTVRLSAWEDVPHGLDSIGRTELEDPELALEDPCFAEIVEEATFVTR